MSEIDFDERIETIESLAVKVANDASKLRTDDELAAVRALIFDGIDDLENRIAALKNNLEMVSRIISSANG